MVRWFPCAALAIGLPDEGGPIKTRFIDDCADVGDSDTYAEVETDEMHIYGYGC
jgi:hypothetical protein